MVHQSGHESDIPAPSPAVTVFDRAADTYDAVGIPWFGPIAHSLVDALGLVPNERVADLGCGTGAVLLEVAERIGPQGSITGVDLSSGMLGRARAEVAARHISSVALKQADVTDPGLEPDAYDVVASSLVLFFLDEPGLALRNWHALLRPGGRIGVTTFGANDPRWDRVDAVFAPYLPQRMLDARTSGRSGPFGSDEGVEELLRAAGFVDVRTLTTRTSIVLPTAEDWYRFSWSHGQRVMWESVPEERRNDVRDEAYALLAEFADADGSVTFHQPVRITLGRRAEP